MPVIFLQPDYQFEPALSLDDHAGTLTGEGRPDHFVDIVDVQSIPRHSFPVVPDNKLGQTYYLFNPHITGALYILYDGSSFIGLFIKKVQVFTIDLDCHIRLHTGHQLIEPQLYRLLELKCQSRQHFQGFFHFLNKIFPVVGCGPFLFILQDDHDICIFHRHRVCWDFGSTDL